MMIQVNDVFILLLLLLFILISHQCSLDNVKALFRRGKANISVWKMDDAKEDLKHLLSLDPSMQVLVNRLICQINEAVKKKDDEDRQKLRGKLF